MDRQKVMHQGLSSYRKSSFVVLGAEEIPPRPEKAGNRYLDRPSTQANKENCFDLG